MQSRDGVVTDHCVLDTAKLEALRAAAQVGVDAIEAGAYRAFESFAAMEDYLRAVTNSALRA